MARQLKRFSALAVVVIAVMVWIASADGTREVLQHDQMVDMALRLDEAAIKTLKATREDKKVPGGLTVVSRSGASESMDVELRLKGQLGSKRSIDDKPAFKIDVKSGPGFRGLKDLTLNNMVQDPTMLHEALGYRVYADAGVPVPDTMYARLTINGEPYGLYLLVESIDRQFLKRRFGDDTGILYEAAYGTDLTEGSEHGFELDEGSDPGHAELLRLISAVSADGDNMLYGSAPLVDRRSFLSMMAVEVLINDWDNYYRSNNYRIYWNPSTRRWSFIPTGIDQTFTHHETKVFGATGVLFRKCIRSERCKTDYIAAVRNVADRFERLELTKKMDRLLSVIDSASQADPRKPYDAAEATSSRARMRELIATRPGEVRSSLEKTGGA